MPPAFALDGEQLRRRLMRLGRVLHPDFFGAADPATRALAERNSARLNQAHDVLADATARADWLVRHLGGPSENEQREMPREFLLAVLEWNEQLEAARESAPGSRERNGLEALESELRTQRASALSAVERLLTPLPERDASSLRSSLRSSLCDARAQLNALRYIDNTLAQIEALALGSTATP